MQVKYLYKSLQRARKEKKQESLFFFLNLQSIGFPQGEILAGSMIKTIQKHFDYSDQTISNQMKRLVKDRFVRVYKHSNGKTWKYTLCSTKTVHRILGFRFKLEDDSPIERHKYCYIDTQSQDPKELLKLQIGIVECLKNKEKQEFKIKEKVEKKIAYHKQSLTNIKSEKIRERKRATLIQLEETIRISSEKTNCQDGEPIVNRISCIKVAQILGYCSSMSALNLLKKAEGKGLLSIKRSKTLITENITKRDFLLNYQFKSEFSKCYWKFGKVYKNECNEIIFLNGIRNLNDFNFFQTSSSKSL